MVQRLGDQPTLTSYHSRAVGCRESDVPGEGPFVVLEDIGATPSHLLSTPSQTSFQSVAAPAYNSGLLNPVANPADAVGQLLNRNLGGDVALQYHFTESMRPVGRDLLPHPGREADASGNPVGSWAALAPMTWSTWKLNTATPGSIALGPHTVGPESRPVEDPVRHRRSRSARTRNGRTASITASSPTSGLADGRYLVMIEVFNAAGARLKPAAAPAAEAGTSAPFTFRRWNVPASTVAVPFAALTHMMWWDNRRRWPISLTSGSNGSPSSDAVPVPRGWARRDGGDRLSRVSSAAGHAVVPARPQPGHHARPERPSWQVANPPGAEVGEGRPAARERRKTLADLLGDEPSGIRNAPSRSTCTPTSRPRTARAR